MHVFLLCLYLLAQPFWETKPARQWNDAEMNQMLTDSPWAQTTFFREAAPLPIYLSTAKPMRDADAEYIRRYTLRAGSPPPTDSARKEYESFLAENEGKVIIVAIRNPNMLALAEEVESHRMLEESILKVGRKKMKLTGHLPPGGSDPVLRLVFPRPTVPFKELTFDLYIPGVNGPYRSAIFRAKDLLFQGKLEM